MTSPDFYSSSTGQDPGGDLISVLLVEDDESFLFITRRYLENTKEFRVDTLTTPLDALNYSNISGYDAIVSDYYMPGMDGIAFLKTIREQYGDIPFILFTVRSREEVLIEAINSGADFYIQKSISMDALFTELIHKIKLAVARKNERISLQDSKKFLSDILDFLPDATFAIDRYGYVTVWNRAIEEMTGLSAQEMVGKGNYEYSIPFYGTNRPLLIDLIDSADEIIAQYYSIVYRTETTLTAETNLSHPKGNQISALVKVSRLYNQAGEIIGAIESIRDISEMKKTEQKLRESEERFRGMTERSSDLIFILDEKMSAAYVSPSVYIHLGYQPDELIGKSMDFAAETIFSKNYLEFMQAVELTMQGKPVENMDMILCRKDGSLMYVSVYVVPITENGNVMGAQASMRDITERRKTELATRALMMSVVETTGANSLRIITETISSWLGADCVVIGELIQENETVHVLSMFLDGNNSSDFSYDFRGTPCEQVTKTGFSLYPDDLACTFPRCKFLSEMRFRGYIGTPLHDSSGNIIGILCVLFRNPLENSLYVRQVLEIIAAKAAADIERSHIEDTLRDSRERLFEAMDLAQLVNWEYDIDKDLFSFDDRFYAMYGTSVDQEGGMFMSSGTYAREFVHPGDFDVVAKEIEKAITAQDPNYVSRLEHRIIRRDGEIRYITVRFSIIKDAEGRTIKTRGANQDITDRKRAEEALRQANKRLNLLSSITRHDILNAVSLILGYLELVEMDYSDSELLKYNHLMKNATKEIQHQIEFTRLYEDLGSHDPVWINLRSVIPKPLVSTSVTLVSDLDHYFIYADSMLEKVFHNLLDNSIRHGQHVTEIRVSARIIDDDLMVTWEDNGIGVADQYKEQIFDRGFGENTGLGMFLAREILSLTGISIHETGKQGTGARFEIRVPEGGWKSKTTLE